MSRGARSERGSMAVEVVLLAPVLMAFVMLVVAFGRFVAVKGDIDAAARDAARAASLQGSWPAAVSAAHGTVGSSLDEGTTCSPAGVGGRWQPNGEVVVELDCDVSLDGLGLIGVPGSVAVRTTSSVPLDPYRRYE